MIVSSMRTKNMDFRCPPCMHFPQKYDHIRPQGRPHENEFKLFSNTKINLTKVGTEKEDEKIESGFQTSLDMVLKMSKIFC